MRLARLGILAIGAAAAFAGASLARGAEPVKEKIDFTRLSNDELWAAYEAAAKRDESDYCGFYEPLLRQLETRGGFGKRVAIPHASAELQCAIEREQWDVAYRQLKYLERAKQKPPLLFGVALARMAGAFSDAATRLVTHIDGIDGGTAFKPESRELWSLNRALYLGGRQAERLQLLRDLAEAPRLAKMPEDDRRGILSALFGAEVESGNMAAAGEMVGNVSDPYSMLAALSDRRYAPLWPQLEAQAGENLGLILHADVKEALTAFEAKPDDTKTLQELAHAYLRAGQFENVVALVEAHRPPPDKASGIDEDMAWALNVEAYALDALGRHGDAEAIFDQLAAIPIDPKKNGWLVSFVINRGSRLVDLGQFEKGLAAAEFAGEVAAKNGSGYARMLVRRDRICALMALGRANETTMILQEVDANVDDAAGAAAEALLCAKAEDRAAALVIAGLNDPAKAQQMVEALQKPDFDLFYNNSVRPSLAAQIRPRKDVDAAFSKAARDIPVRFVPLFGKRRSELSAKEVAAN